jgi:GxxExxY protein
MAKWRGEDLANKIINACINVHKESGPGFLESIYHNALVTELKKQNIAFESEKEVRITYLGSEVGIHKLDLLVEGDVILEIKAVEDFNKRHYSQVRSYLKALNKQVGLLVNFSSYKLDVRRVELDKA